MPVWRLMRPGGSRVLLPGLLASGCLITLLAASATVKVTLPANARQTGGRLVLHLENLKLPPNSSGMVRVFADMPGANATTSTDDDHFLGYFTILPKTSAEAVQGIRAPKATLDLSPRQHKLAGKKQVLLTLVPLRNESGASPRAAGEKPTFARAYVVKE